MCPSCHALQPLATTERFVAGAVIEHPGARYVLDRRLGEGGMATVWRAWQFFAPTDPRGPEPKLVALKVMRMQAGIERELRAFFQREADALARLSHPNIVALSELFEYEGRVILSLEYVDGDALDAVIARNVARARLAGPGALPGMAFLRAWHYVEQLLGALASAHALGIVHRDVKPGNVLVRRDGLVKLTDFGIAKVLTDQARTRADAAPGTGAYMSPEQVQSGPVDGRSDLYSAGIVLYETLSGRLPFPTEERSEFAVRQDQVERAPPPIRTYLPQAPPVIDALFARALAKNPADRFPDAITMGTAFRAAFGLPESEEWRAQAELAKVARDRQLDVPAHQPRAATLRDFLAVRYRTAPLPARKA